MYYFMRKFLSLIVMLVMGMTMLMAQTKTVTGTVVSAEDGEPIIGASVIIPGTTTGTVTDIDGNFSVLRQIWWKYCLSIVLIIINHLSNKQHIK